MSTSMAIGYSLTVEDYSNRVLSNKVIWRHKKRREALHCRSLHVLRLLELPCKSERATSKPHAVSISTTLLCPKLPLVYGYTNGLDTMRAVYITTKGHSPLLCFWLAFRNFSRISERQNQSVVNAFQYVYRAPTNMFGVSDATKIEINSELWMVNGELFWQSEIATMTMTKQQSCGWWLMDDGLECRV